MNKSDNNTTSHEHLKRSNNKFDIQENEISLRPFAGFQEKKDSYEIDLIERQETNASLELQKLQLIHEERALAAQNRIQQRKDAMQLIETTRLQALERARRQESIGLAIKHHFGNYGWKLLNKLFVIAKRRKAHYIIEKAVRFAAFRNVLTHLSDNAGRRGQAVKSLVFFSCYHAWRLFRRQHVSRFRTEKHCRRFLGELLRATMRKRMTNTAMDVYFEQYSMRQALQQLRRTTVARQNSTLVAMRHVVRKEKALREKYFALLNSHASGSMRRRAASRIFLRKTCGESLRRLSEFALHSQKQRMALRSVMTDFYLKQLSSGFHQLASHHHSQRKGGHIKHAVKAFRQRSLSQAFQQLLDAQRRRERLLRVQIVADDYFKRRVMSHALRTLSEFAQLHRKVNLHSKRRPGEVRKAFQCLVFHTSRGTQRKTDSAVRLYVKNATTVAFRCLSNRVSERMAFVDGMKQGVSLHWFRILSGALTRWRVQTVRNRAVHRNSMITSRILHKKLSHVQRRAVKCFDKWLRVYRVAQRVRQLCLQRTERASFKLFHFWRAVSHISAVKRRCKRQRVRKCLYRKAWAWFRSSISACVESSYIQQRAKRASLLLSKRNLLRMGLHQLVANCERQHLITRRVRGGSRLSSHRYLRSGLELWAAYVKRRLQLKKRCVSGSKHSKGRTAITVSKTKIMREFIMRLVGSAKRLRHLMQAKRFYKLKVFRKFVEFVRNRSVFQQRRLARKALNKRQILMRSAAWTKWCARTAECVALSTKNRMARRWHASVLLRGGLRDWLDHTSRAAERAYLKPSRTRLACARRLTLFRRWLTATAARVEHTTYVSTFRRHHHKSLLKKTLLFLRSAHEARLQVRDMVRDYRCGALASLLQGRFFLALRRAVHRRRQARVHDPKITKTKLRRAFITWETVHNGRKTSRNSKGSALSFKSTTSTLKAVQKWRDHRRSLATQTDNLDLSKSYHAIVLWKPALNQFSKHRVAARMQKAAKTVALQHRLEVAWDRAMARWRAAASARRRRRVCVTQGVEMYQRKSVAKMFDAFLQYSSRFKLFNELVSRAKAVHARSLQAKSFTGLFEHYLEGITLTERATAQNRYQACKRALKRLRSLVKKRRTSKIAVQCRNKFTLKKCLLVSIRKRHNMLVERRRHSLRGGLLFRRRYLDKYLTKWLQYAAARRQVGFTERQAIRQRRMERRAELNQHFSSHAFLRCMYLLRLNRRDRKVDRQTGINVKIAMDNVRRRQAFLEWRRWNHAKRSSKRQVVECVDVVDDARLLSVFPALLSNARARKTLRRADEYWFDSTMRGAWKAWKKFAQIQTKRVKHKRLRFKRRQSFISDLTRSKSFMSDMTGASSSSAIDVTNLADYLDLRTVCSEGLNTIFSETEQTGAEGEMVVEHGGDFRVSTQNRRLLDGHHLYETHLKQEGLRQWTTLRTAHLFRRKAIGFLLLRRYKRLFRRWRRLISRSHAARKRTRKAVQLFSEHHGLSVLNRLTEVVLLNTKIRKISRRMLVAHWKSWRDQFRVRGTMKRIITSTKATVDYHRLAAAFLEWTRSTEIDRTAENQLLRVTARKMLTVVDAMKVIRKNRRKQRGWSRRAAHHHSDRGLRSVYSNMLFFLGEKYALADKIKEAHAHYLQYQCRATMEALRHLRRNRIAKDFDLRKQFKAFTLALEVHRSNKHLAVTRMKKGNKEAQRRPFRRLLHLVRINMTKKVIKRVRTSVPSVRTGVKASEALTRYSAIGDKTRGLLGLRNHLWFRKKVARREVKSFECHVVYGVIVSFRKLLSYARMRLLKRKNIQALIDQRSALRMRDVFSTIILSIDKRFARTHQNRLLDLHARSAVLLRGLNALRKQKGIKRRHFHHHSTVEEEGDGEEKNSEIAVGLRM
eukprot:gene23179-29373_t